MLSETWLWYTTRGSGIVSLILLSAVVVLGILTSRSHRLAGWPRFVTAGLHRNLALLGVVFVAVHVVAAAVDPFTHLGWIAALVPFGSPYRTFWLGLGALSMELLLAVVLTSLARPVLGQRGWRAVHWLAYAAWPSAVLHTLGTGSDVHLRWMDAVLGVCVGAVALAVALRVFGPPTHPLQRERQTAGRLASPPRS